MERPGRMCFVKSTDGQKNKGDKQEKRCQECNKIGVSDDRIEQIAERKGAKELKRGCIAWVTHFEETCMGAVKENNESVGSKRWWRLQLGNCVNSSCMRRER